LDQDGILLTDYVSKSQTIIAEFYSSLLVKFQVILKEKPRGKFTKTVLFMHDSVPVHPALPSHKKLAYMGFHIFVTHPILRICPPWITTYSLD
jgi:hypothetical protein